MLSLKGAKHGMPEWEIVVGFHAFPTALKPV
jgi:hypothetical protein